MSDGFSNAVVGGAETLVRSGMRSQNYVASVDGWRVAKTGFAEFLNTVIRGTLSAGGGTVTIDNTGVHVVTATTRYDIDVTTGFTMKNIPDNGEKLTLNAQGLQQNPVNPTPAGFVSLPGKLVPGYANLGSSNETLIYELDGPTYQSGGNSPVVLLYGSPKDNSRSPQIFITDTAGQALGGSPNPALCELGRGVITSIDDGTTQSGITGEAVVLTSPIKTFMPGRAYRIHSFSRYNFAVAPGAASSFAARFRKNNLAGTNISNIGNIEMPNSASTFPKYVEQIFTVALSGSPVTCSIAMTIQSTNSISQQGGRNFIVEDFADAFLWQNQMVLS